MLPLIPLRAADPNAGSASDMAKAECGWRSPGSLASAADGKTLYLATPTSAELLALEAATGQIRQSIPLPSPASGLALNPEGTRLYVTCPGPSSRIGEVDLSLGSVRTWAGRHTAMSPVLAPDGATLYVCHRFSSSVSAYAIKEGRELFSIPVAREPISAALTRDGQFLLVAHHLPNGNKTAATVTVIDVAKEAVVKELTLPNGSTLLREIRVSPDGTCAVVTHNLARFQTPTTQLDRGWMNTSAMTLIDLKELRLLSTVLLDDVDHGAANPWGLDWSADGRWLCVAHAGTHEVSVISFPELRAKLNAKPEESSSAKTRSVAVENDLAFLVRLRQRVRLEGNGPRALRVVGPYAYVASYFSGTLEKIDLAKKCLAGPAVNLNENTPPPRLLLGEQLFNDARICFQEWQTCGTCHSEDARIDGLNWDLLNDGLGNPKNSKTLLFSHRTPPAMSTGVRETAKTAVRAGIRHILFSVQPESVAVAMDEWLETLRPVPSPHLINGELSAAAVRGQQLFRSPEVGCVNCHSGELGTDLQEYNVGTATPLDRGVTHYDTPALAEAWRTGPYLHDGSAATVREVLTTRNATDSHGRTSTLTPEQVNDLLEYVLSL